MPSPYADLDRPPLSEAALRRALAPDFDVHLLAETGSTNADAAALARRGAPEGVVVVAESQTAGRGRLDRAWAAPPRAGLTFSVVLRPRDVPAQRWGWVPLLAGVAVAEAVAARARVEATLKWPNDVLAGNGRKLAGLLAERADDAVVVGIGLNVTTRAAELADLPDATSLALEGARRTDRDPLLREMLRRLATHYAAWRDSGGAPLPDYVAACGTIGRDVRVELPEGAAVTGVATGIDDDGRLLVRDARGAVRAYSAGDVRHLR